MTLQDFVSTINDTLLSFGQTYLPFFIPLLAVLLTILIGILAAELLTTVTKSLSNFLSIEKALHKLENYRNLEKLSSNFTLTSFAARLIWIITLLVFVFAALQLAGFRETDKVLTVISEFLPRLVAGSVLLLLGTVLAYFALVLTTILGTLGKFPSVTLFSRSIATVIIIFSGSQALVAFGLNSETIRFLTIGLIAAFSLAVGLGIKDTISQTLKNFWNQKL